MTGLPAAAAGTLRLGGDLTVHRMGYGAMRISGFGGWGQPPDRDAAKAAVRRAVELGVTLIDTSDSFGPGVSETLIAEALYPYPDDLVIATKGGVVWRGGRREPAGSPSQLRRACEDSLRRLRLEQIPLYQLACPDPGVPVAESAGALAELRQEGKIRHIGVAKVTEAQLREARQAAWIVSVQNHYNVENRMSDPVLDLCTRDRLAFLPCSPLQFAELIGPFTPAARRLGVTERQVVLAWLLYRSPRMLPIPGSGSARHVEENVAAAAIELTAAEVAALTDAVVCPSGDGIA